MLDKRLDTLMPTVSSTLSNTEATRFKVKIVIDDNKMFKRLFILMHNLFNGKPATIHVCMWLDKKNALCMKIYPIKMGPMLKMTLGNRKHFCEQICHPKADIMTSFSILFTGVP
jgi:hypothetical protein